MEVGLISDTHGWVHPEALNALQGCDVILHAGDVGDPEVLAALLHVAPVRAVGGNVDPAGLYPAALDEILEGVSIHVSHGHERGWWPTPEWLVARYPGHDIVIFGHTHRTLVKTIGPVLIINPGCAARNQTHPTVARLTLPSRQVQLIRLASSVDQ